MTHFSIGHGSRTWEEFVSLLRENHVTTLVDVRRYPRSRTNPQFNTEVFSIDLPMDYLHLVDLGGRRGRTLDESPNTYWTNDSFRNYADWTTSSEFKTALGILIEIPGDVAYMCSEVVWWRCHRRIVTDHLILNGLDVRHIMGPGRTVPAVLNECMEPDLVYRRPERSSIEEFL